MMRRHTLLFLFLIGTLHGMSQSRERADQVYQWLLDLKGDSIIAIADSHFRSAVSAKQLTQGFALVQFQYGRVQKADPWIARNRESGEQSYTRRLLMNRHAAFLSVSFRGDSLSGLLIGQPQPVDDIPLAENERPITVSTDGFNLPGRLTLPEGARRGKTPCVILVHGSGPGNMNETVGKCSPFLDLAEGLSRRGIAVIRFDKRSYVYSDAMAGEGRDVDYDTESVDDALAAIRLACSLPEVDRRRIFIVGHSLGGMLAPRIAQRSTRKLRGLVMLASPPMTLQAVMREQIARLMQTDDSVRVDSALQVALRTLPTSYLAMDSAYSVGLTARSLRLPMLILQGERDAQVTMDDYRRWDAFVADRKRVIRKTYPRLNHLMMEGEGAANIREYNTPAHIPDYLLDDIADFIMNVGRYK